MFYNLAWAWAWVWMAQLTPHKSTWHASVQTARLSGISHVSVQIAFLVRSRYFSHFISIGIKAEFDWNYLAREPSALLKHSRYSWSSGLTSFFLTSTIEQPLEERTLRFASKGMRSQKKNNIRGIFHISFQLALSWFQLNLYGRVPKNVWS